MAPEFYYSDFPKEPPPFKKHKVNPVGENIYLRPDGTLDREEDKIVACQRIWKEKAYAPITGVMYMRGMKRFHGY